ncbi:hypothetical protein [Clostridium sp. OS1-26]|uniref:hypothetical protein n=1 Tax=Clostridium sp. OS1-26 TaxID=3070681 RepID=UPI0027E1A9D7|nr:hypothetical protein [Clostridium sp. OS1-26]WML33521.1 hypothetical protein RCG18_19545 [Clostridium sp. OS1-26]
MNENEPIEIVVEQTLDIDAWKDIIKEVIDNGHFVNVYKELNIKNYTEFFTVHDKEAYSITITCYIDDFYDILSFLQERHKARDIICVNQGIEELNDEIEFSEDDK